MEKLHGGDSVLALLPEGQLHQLDDVLVQVTVVR